MIKSVGFSNLLSFIGVCLTLGCVGEGSQLQMLRPDATSGRIGSHSSCPTLAPALKSRLKSRMSYHLGLKCYEDQHRFSALAFDLSDFRDREEDLKKRPECFQQAVRLAALESREFPTICQPYLEFVKTSDNQVSKAACGEMSADVPRQETSSTLEHALQACADAILELSQRKKHSRKQFSLEAALKLHQKGKLGFHITPSHYANFIQTIGLDPRLGGHRGLADNYRNTPIIGTKYREYRLPKAGLTHVTQNPEDAGERADIYNFASANAQVIAVRLDEKFQTSPDPALGPGNFVTDQWIWSEDLVLIPPSRWKEFGIPTPTAARLARIKAASQTIKPSPIPQSIDPALVKFSQDSVSGAQEITESLQKYGWLDSLGHIDIVKIADGSLITADNTRLLGASRAGVFVKGVVHDENEVLSAKMAKRFTTLGDGTPRTWGEAVKFRINCGKQTYRTNFPTGAHIVGSRD